MVTHTLKLNEEFADAVYSGDKNFEVRYNDRGFQKGDEVKFEVMDGSFKVSHSLTGRKFVITYVLNGWGLEPRYVVFGIKMKEE